MGILEDAEKTKTKSVINRKSFSTSHDFSIFQVCFHSIPWLTPLINYYSSSYFIFINYSIIIIFVRFSVLG